MKMILDRGPYWLVSSAGGEETLLPADLVSAKPTLAELVPFVEGGKPESFERGEGYYARLSAPGYLDATPCFACQGEQEARDHVAEAYGVPQCSLCRELQEDEEDEEGEPCQACQALAARGWQNPSGALNADPEPFRVVRLAAGPGYVLELYDANRSQGNKHGVSYRLFRGDEETPLFTSEGGKELYTPSAIDSDGAARALLGFLTLKPGDTDPDYFDGYTEAQLDFARGDAEELDMVSRDLLGED